MEVVCCKVAIYDAYHVLVCWFVDVFNEAFPIAKVTSGQLVRMIVSEGLEKKYERRAV